MTADIFPERPSAKPENAAMLEAVKTRGSIRNYDPVPLKGEHIESIRSYLNDKALMTGPLGREFQLSLLTDTTLKDKPRVGTYGFVKNAQAYVVGVSSSEPLVLFELGYVFHGLILYLTHLGLGTVWMGGTFNREDVKKSVHVAGDEIVPAISPVGYPKGSRHFKEHIQNAILRTVKRKPMDEVYFLGGFDAPLVDDAALYHRALDLARRSPSAKNKQPWRVVISRDLSRAHFYVSFSLKGEVGTGLREYACPPEYLDVGCHYRSFEVAMTFEGIDGSLQVENPGIKAPDDGDYEYIASWVRA